MPSRRTIAGVSAAILVYGVFAGISVNRDLVEMPAWQQVGPIAWANFSRYADLSVVGTGLYAMGAITGAIFCIAAAMCFRIVDRSTPRAAAIPIYGAAVMSVAALLVTTQAAPIMQSVPGLGQDPVALQQALDGFRFWGNIRGVVQVLAFIASLWSLLALALAAVQCPSPTTRSSLHAEPDQESRVVRSLA